MEVLTNQPIAVHPRNRVKKLKKSATLEINEQSKKLVDEGREIFKLGFGQSPFPVPEPVINALKANAHQKDYLAVKGLPALCEAVAGFYRKKYNLDISGSRVMIGPGSKELLYILQMVYPGELLLPSPSWVSYAPQAFLSRKKINSIDTSEENGWKLDPDDLEKCLSRNGSKPKILLLNYPSNPTGSVFTDSELAAIANVARKHGVLILSDEIYGELTFNGDHKAIAAHYPEGTIISSGLSKWCGAGGWRLGHFAFPKALEHIVQAMSVVASETFTSTSSPIQYAAIKAYEPSAEIEAYVEQSRSVLKSVGTYVYGQLRQMDITCPVPEGGFYCFPNFQHHKTLLNKLDVHGSTAFCKKLLQDTGIALLPGSAFGRPEDELTARLSFVDFDGQNALERRAKSDSNMANTVHAVSEIAPKIVQAMDVLKNWLHNL